MAKRKGGGFPGGKNMQGMMKQMQKMQQDMQRMQQQLEETEYEASVGGGAVKATVSGEKVLTSISIDPDILEDDVEMLEDMIIAAVNEAISKANKDAENKMGSLTGGLGGLGGLGIPGL